MTQLFSDLGNPDLAAALASGEIGVIPTDTLYGVVASAKNPAAVERVYSLRQRDTDKPMIVLIASFGQLADLGVVVSPQEKAWLDKLWPGPFSVILACPDVAKSYLHRGTNTLAVRCPDHPSLRQLINQAGPVVAPSANPEGQVPALSIAEAEAYFGDAVDFYVDAGELQDEPSTLIKIVHEKAEIIRQGKGEIK